LKVLVTYYSHTGNTEKAAEALAKGVKRVGASVVVKRVEDVDSSELGKYGLICIGTPVRYFRPVRRVREFLEKLPNLEGKFGVAFSTHGGLGPGRSLSAIGKALRGKGAKVLGSMTTVAANHHYRLFVLHGDRPNENDLRKFEEFGGTIAKVAIWAIR
jgi:NAD(P)H dehydrogenase (quinone)